MPNRRASIALTAEEQADFLEKEPTIQIASIGPKGFPHLVAMWFVVIDGKVHFSTFRKSQKVLNLRRNPKISAMVETGDVYSELKGLVIEGEAEIIDDLETTQRVMGLVGQKMAGRTNAAPADQPGGGMDSQAPKRVIIRINPVDTYSWDHSKLGGRY